MVVTKSLPLDSDHFNFDLTEGFEMAVEKDWNVLDFTDLNDQLTIYDADLRPMQPTNYGVRIFYKACIPMCYVDPETYESNPLVKTANNSSFHGKYLDLVDGTVIGSPVNKMSQGSSTEQGYGEFGYHALLIDEDAIADKPAYALPDDRALNHTNVAKWAFAGGSSIASCKVDTDYYQPKDTGTYNENIQNVTYMLMNKGGLNDGGVASFIVNNGALAYSIDTSANRFNIPTDGDHVNNHKYLQPALFVPFGVAFRDHLTLNNHETPVDTAGWFYCILGVNEVGGEDPSYQIDPQLIRLSDGEGLQIDPVAETYTYSDDISSDSGTFGIEVADYCEIVSITLNNESIQVPSPVNNVYSISFSDLTSGTNTLVVRTQDENEQALTYTFSLSYTPGPTPPTPTENPEARFRLAVDGGQTSVNIVTQDDVTTYTGSFDGDYAGEGMMIRVQHEDEDKPFTLVSYTINDTPITLTQGETGDYSTFLTGPNVPDPTDGYEVEIVLALGGNNYTYTLNLTYLAPTPPTPTVNPDAWFTVSFTGPGATGFMQETEAGVTSYSGTFSGDPSTLPLQLTVAHMDTDKDFTLTSYKINNLTMVLTPDADGDYVATLTGSDIPDPTNGYDIEIVLELDNVSYTYTITLTYTGA